MNLHRIALLVLVALPGPTLAGLHYSAEKIAELPSQWRGYLLDQRALRLLAVPPGPARLAMPLQLTYQDDRDRLIKLAVTRTLTADESADLGALHVRLGEPDRAVELLRAAHRTAPDHFAIASNLGTACQLTGDLQQAAIALEIAVSLAPPRWKAAESLHLKLVRSRLREKKNAGHLDALFEIVYPGKPGVLDEATRSKLPADALASLQALGLWLPADGRLLWQLGELANATGDVVTGAAILDGCVSDFGLNDPQLRDHRQAYRAAAPITIPGKGDPSAHDAHKPQLTVRFLSPRPLIRQSTALKLPAIKPDGINLVPWELLADTTLEKPFRPNYAEHLRKLDGKRIVMTGFIHPASEGLEQIDVYFVENPIGCWFCDRPDPLQMIHVQSQTGKTITLSREAVRIEGTLQLNHNDPEEYLYTIKDAKVGLPQ